MRPRCCTAALAIRSRSSSDEILCIEQASQFVEATGLGCVLAIALVSSSCATLMREGFEPPCRLPDKMLSRRASINPLGAKRRLRARGRYPPALACRERRRRARKKRARQSGLLSNMAEREGFEPPCRLPGKTLSRRPRYDHFGTSPFLALGAAAPRGSLRPLA